jgi:hypothetical protein
MTKDFSISGVTHHLTGRSHWRPILEQWIRTQETYCKCIFEDAAYWYTERTNIGLLAHAAWAAGYVALEEHQKIKRGKIDRRRKSNGRADLWIAKKDYSESIEAKQKYICAGHKTNARTLELHLKNACDDAKRASSNTDSFDTGILFAPVYMPVTKNRSADAVVAEIQKTVASAKAVNCNFAAWCFPRSSRILQNERGFYYYPGVVLVGSRIDSA